MGRQLTNTSVDFISLVKKGANGEKVTVFKSAELTEDLTEELNNATNQETIEKSEDTETMTKEEVTTMKGFFKMVKEFFGGTKTDIEKSQDLPSPDYTSFNSVITNQKKNVSQAIWTLQDVIWEIYWNDSIENGKELILKNIDEFRNYVAEILTSPVEVQKEAFTKIEKEEFEVKKEDLQALLNETLAPVTKAVNDLTEKVQKMEKSEEAGTAEETKVEKSEEEATETKTEVQKEETLTSEVVKGLLAEVLTPISKSLEGISSRVEALEQVRGISKAAEATEIEKADTDLWQGLLPFTIGDNK